MLRSIPVALLCCVSPAALGNESVFAKVLTGIPDPPEECPGLSGAHWAPMRIVYLQYASDPVTFFDYRDLYREPDWMVPPRGPDVSPRLRWYPVVTFLQLTLDMAMSTTAPMGYGHVYAPAHYIDAWVEVTDVQGWTLQDISRLKQHFETSPTESISTHVQN